MLTMNNRLIPKSLSSKTGYTTSATIQSKVLGHTVKEVQVIKTSSSELPIPIKLPTPRSPPGSKTTRSIKSPLTSPIISPRSITSNKTFAFSPKPQNPLSSQRQVISTKRLTRHSPKQDIEHLVKNSLQQEKNQQTIQKIQSKQAIKLKLKKKLQMKVFDELIRQENFTRFKQKSRLTRPKWLIDDKKVITDAKSFRDIEKIRKQHKTKKVSVKFEDVPNKKKKVKKLHKENEKFKHENFDDLLTGHKNIFHKIKNRAKKYQTDTENSKTRKLIKLLKALERPIKRFFFLKLALNPPSLSSSSLSYLQEDTEVQLIMNMQKPLTTTEDTKSNNEKSYEKILETQTKLNLNQQGHLINLKTQDMQEMNKLAEVFEDNPEIKQKFEGMIERRYSKLENLFKENMENIKQALGNEDFEEKNNFDGKNLEDMIPELRNTVSEFSSSFLMQLNEVPFAFNVTFEDQVVEPGEIEDSFDSPSDDSLYSRDTLSEPEDHAAEFPLAGGPCKFENVYDEPCLPLISESLIMDARVKARNTTDSIEELVGGIAGADRSDDMICDDNTLDLNAQVVPSQNHMYILEDSYNSSQSYSNANFSSISFTSPPEPEARENSHHSETKPHRIITEKFPSPFTAIYESSTEIEGYELIINRIIFTLENDIYTQIYEELKSDNEYWSEIPKKPQIPLKPQNKTNENQVQTDSQSILSIFKRLQQIKPQNNLIQSVLQIYNPLSMLARIQEEYNEDDEIRIFNYTDIEKISINSTSLNQNPFIATHNQVVVDAVNEALCRCAKSKVNMPWKIQDQVLTLEYKDFILSADKKIGKWAGIEAGKIPDLDMIDCFGNLDQDKLRGEREERLGKLLIVDVLESDKSWVECDFEETQTALELAEFVLGVLCVEIGKFVG